MMTRSSSAPPPTDKFFPIHCGKYFPLPLGRRRRGLAAEARNTGFRCMASDLPGDGRVHLDSRSRPVSRRFVAMLLVAGLITIVPLAHGSPPDPTWIAGLYDDADHDDAVLAITDASGVPATDGVVVARARPSRPRATFASATRPYTGSRLSPVDRAPPQR